MDYLLQQKNILLKHHMPNVVHHKYFHKIRSIVKVQNICIKNLSIFDHQGFIITGVDIESYFYFFNFFNFSIFFLCLHSCILEERDTSPLFEFFIIFKNCCLNCSKFNPLLKGSTDWNEFLQFFPEKLILKSCMKYQKFELIIF